MKLIENTADIHPEFNFDRFKIPKEEILFLDIETTGISPESSGLYLIGLLYYENGKWMIRQLFAESMLDEQKLLLELKAIIEGDESPNSPPNNIGSAKRKNSPKSLIISFNGDRFDLPYLQSVSRQYYLPSYLDSGNIESFDIYKEIKPLKNLLKLPNLKLKTIERFLHIDREDTYSGGELIQVYQQYLSERNGNANHQSYHDTNYDDYHDNFDKLKVLLRHNAEDIMNLPLILPICSYSKLFTEMFCLESSEIVPDPAGFGKILDLWFSFDEPIPRPLDFERDEYCLNLTGNHLNLCTRLFEGELLQFFPNYKEYFYLPFEDRAIHKSLGQFVEARFRKKATAKTAYEKRTGLFLPEPKSVFNPRFRESYKSKLSYALYTEDILKDKMTLNEYVHSVLDFVIK